MPSTSVRSKTMYAVVPSTPIRLRSLSVRTVSGVPPSARDLEETSRQPRGVVEPAAIRRPGWRDTHLDDVPQVAAVSIHQPDAPALRWLQWLVARCVRR